MKRVLITGATGFIGYHLVNEMRLHDVEVYAVCSENSDNTDRIVGIPGVRIIKCNLGKIEHLPEIIEERGFDAFYHIAWKGASGKLRTDYNVQMDNIRWTLNALEVSVKLNCKKFIATGTVCENQCTDMINHNTFFKSSYYITAKRTAYEMIKYRCSEIDYPFVWCTFYHPVGKFNKHEQLIMSTALKLKYGGKLNFGSASQWFDVIAVEDLCHGLFLAGDCELKKDRYFIGSGKPRILKDYLEEMKDIISPDAVMNYGYYTSEELIVKKEWLDISEFQNETGYKPLYPFNKVIEKIYREI